MPDRCEFINKARTEFDSRLDISNTESLNKHFVQDRLPMFKIKNYINGKELQVNKKFEKRHGNIPQHAYSEQAYNELRGYFNDILKAYGITALNDAMLMILCLGASQEGFMMATENTMYLAALENKHTILTTPQFDMKQDAEGNIKITETVEIEYIVESDYTKQTPDDKYVMQRYSERKLKIAQEAPAAEAATAAEPLSPDEAAAAQAKAAKDAEADKKLTPKAIMTTQYTVSQAGELTLNQQEFTITKDASPEDVEKIHKSFAGQLFVWKLHHAELQQQAQATITSYYKAKTGPVAFGNFWKKVVHFFSWLTFKPFIRNAQVTLLSEILNTAKEQTQGSTEDYKKYFMHLYGVTALMQFHLEHKETNLVGSELLASCKATRQELENIGVASKILLKMPARDNNGEQFMVLHKAGEAGQQTADTLLSCAKDMLREYLQDSSCALGADSRKMLSNMIKDHDQYIANKTTGGPTSGPKSSPGI